MGVLNVKVGNQWIDIPSIIGAQGPQGPKGDKGDKGEPGDVADQEKLSEAVSDWLDAHPEATVNLANGSISWDKLTDDVKTIIRDVNVRDTVNQNADLDIADTSGNVLVRLNNGHIQTKNFNSSTLYGDIEDIHDDISDLSDSLDQLEGALESAVDQLEQEIEEKQDSYVVDDVPTFDSDNLVKSGGVYDAIDSIHPDATIRETVHSDTSDLNITDQQGNVIARFANGHISTKNFNSSELASSFQSKQDAPADAGSVGQVLTLNGNLQPTWMKSAGNDDSSIKVTPRQNVDLDITDGSGSVLARFSNGHFKTKYFDTSTIDSIALPLGGKEDQIIVKNSSVDRDVRWQYRKMKTRMEFGAHNGAEYYAPECTVAAYRMAGIQGWEWAWIAGIAFSRDGSMYVIHDDSVDRTTDGSGDIALMSDEEIDALNVDIENGDYSLSDFDPSELKVPTLEQVIQQCVRYGMKMVMRLSLFPNGKDTAENTAKWEAFEDLIHGYNIKPEDMSCYLDTGTKALTCRTLFGEDVEISTHLGRAATAADFVDWFESRNLTGRRAAILSYENTSLEAVKLLHSHGIRVYSYGTNMQIQADNCASWGVDIYQNGRIHNISY